MITILFKVTIISIVIILLFFVFDTLTSMR